MKNKQVCIGAFVAALLGVGTASAGMRATSGVTIDTASRTASGGLSTAYNSADKLQLIYCLRVAYSGGDTWITCAARDANNVTRSCMSDEPALIATVAELNSDSRLIFKWDDNGNCSYVQVGKLSSFDPKIK